MELTLEITNYCPHHCGYCSSSATPWGAHLSFETITKFLEKHDDAEKINRINISGGEPLSHPDFYEILCACESICNNVYVYTNALSHIIFNADILHHGVDVSANLVLRPGQLYLPENVPVHLLKLCKQGRAENWNIPEILLSGNLRDDGSCERCEHRLLRADGKEANAPCDKRPAV